VHPNAHRMTVTGCGSRSLVQVTCAGASSMDLLLATWPDVQECHPLTAATKYEDRPHFWTFGQHSKCGIKLVGPRVC
jgi:hypothetical protein